MKRVQGKPEGKKQIPGSPGKGRAADGGGGIPEPPATEFLRRRGKENETKEEEL